MYNYIHQNIVDTISKIEKKFPVHNLIYKNVRIWPLIKADFNFQMIINNSDEIAKLKSQNKNWKQKIGDILASYKIYKKCKKIYREELKKDNSLNQLPSKAKCLFITFSTFRTKTINDIRFDSQYDSFLSTVSDTTKFCALEFHFGEDANTPSLSVSHKISILKTKAELQIKKSKIWKYTLDFLGINHHSQNKKTQDEFIAFLQKENMQCVFNTSYFEEKTDWILYLKDDLKKIYKKIQPEYVLCPSYFNFESFASTLACHELGIKTIEIQHGVYAQPVYCYYSNIPKEGYELLPDYFFSWDALQANLINDWAKETSKHKALVYGLNGLTFWKKNKESFINKNLINLQPLLAQMGKSKVLFTISDSIDKKLPQLIKNTEQSCFWFIRNHPRAANAPFILDFVKTMQQLNCNNYEIENSTHAPLYPLLWEMDYHVTMISSVVCEAFQIGLPSIVINESGKQLFYDFYQNTPLVLFSTNSDEILNFINTAPEVKKEFKITQNQNFEDFTSNL